MEITIVKFFNRSKSDRFNKLVNVLSRVRFLVFFWISVAVCFLLFDKIHGEEIFLSMVVASILHFLITEAIIKHLLTKIWGKRLRPYLKYPEIKSIGRKFKDSSFPSSHMATTAAILWIIITFYPIFWPVAVFLLISMGYIRMYQGMHYPSDILAGMFLGICYGWVGIYAVSKILLYNNF